LVANTEWEEYRHWAQEQAARTERHLKSLHAPMEHQCMTPCPFQDLGAWCKPCVRREAHGGMHYDGAGWWSDEQAAEEVERIAQSIHNA